MSRHDLARNRQPDSRPGNLFGGAPPPEPVKDVRQLICGDTGFGVGHVQHRLALLSDLTNMASGTLTPAQKTSLAAMAEEEKLAHDFYVTFAGVSAPEVLAVYTHLLARVPAPPRGIRRLITGLTILATSGSGDRVRTFQFDLYTPLGMLSSMEPTATSSSSPSPQSAVAISLFQRLRGVFGGSPTDGSLGSKIKGERALEVVRGGASLLDVRESSEWRSGHAPGAIHVPLGDIDKAPRRLPKGRPVVVMCASGIAVSKLITSSCLNKPER